jgi:Zn-dependent protease with chaperone function
MLTLCLAILLACVAPRIVPAPRAQVRPNQGQAAAAAPANPQPAYSLPPDKLAQAIAISRIRNIMDIIGGLWGIAVLWLLLSTRSAACLEAWAKSISTRRWIQGLIFFAAFIVITTLAGLPLAWFSQYEEKSYAVSVQSWGSWLADQGKMLALSVLIGALVLILFNRIVRRWPRGYWFGIWLVTLPLLVFSIFISPFIAPLFDKFEPLEQNHAALVAKLETVVARTGINIPPSRMYLMKASAKYNGINAYVAGIGSTKRYVMWDTATDRLPDDEILFVFGHESGHYVLHHIPKMIAGIACALFFVYWACAGFAAWLARRFGTRWGLSELEDGTPLASRAGFVVLLFAISVAGFVLEPASNTFSRHFEHQADIYGQEAIHGLVPDPQKTAVSAFNHLGEAWLEDPDPSPFIEFWEYNHPSVQTRANFAEHYDPWANGGHGEFFNK